MIFHLYIGYKPRNKEELFNLHHASAWNIIECIFGVLKRCFRILLIAPEYNLDIQALHNFIRTHDADEIIPELDVDHDNTYDHDHAASSSVAVELDHPSEKRDLIAQQMWEDYICVHEERGLDDEDEFADEDEDVEGSSNSEDGAWCLYKIWESCSFSLLVIYLRLQHNEH